jgi:hypothetical protein
MSDQLYNIAFQNLFQAFLLRDGMFLEHVHGDVIPELFNNEYAQRTTRIVLDFWNKEHSAPGDLIFHVLDDLRKQGTIPESLIKNLNAYIDNLFAIRLENRNYVLKEFDRFIRHKLFQKNVLPAAELVKAGKFDEAEELIRQTFLHRPKPEHELGTLYDQDPSKRIRRRLEEDSQRFWWLVPEIDSRVRGLKRGELGVLQSQRSSGGKSAGLVFLARQVAFQNKKVLIYTLEMSEQDYEDRLDQCIAGIGAESLTDYKRIQKKVSKMFKYGGRVFIKQFPGHLTTVSDLRKHKILLEQTINFHADLVIVDYADELGVEKRSKANNSFEAGKEVYSYLRGWATKENVAIWTGMQSNRSAGEANIADMEHSGESIAKAWVADLIMSINRDKQETQEGITRLHFVKNRTGRAQFTIKVKTDFSKMLFIVPERYSV